MADWKGDAFTKAAMIGITRLAMPLGGFAVRRAEGSRRYVGPHRDVAAAWQVIAIEFRCRRRSTHRRAAAP